MIRKLFPNGKSKVLSFSFDDGSEDDERLLDLLNKYNCKATFNLNAGLCRNEHFKVQSGNVQLWKDCDELRELYHNHEIASHSFTHPHLTQLSVKGCEEELKKDICALHNIFRQEIRGFASPFGDFNYDLIKVLKSVNLCYHRTTKVDKDFYLPSDFLDWTPGPHFSYYTTDQGLSHLNNFINTEKELACLYIWGHSFELSNLNCYSKEWWNGVTDRWNYIERNILIPLSDKNDIWYATNIEIFDYVSAMRSANITDLYIENCSDYTLFFCNKDNVFSVKPKSKIAL